ncbi:MAG: TonB-dependent receptor domain-containing protein, partial [Gemmobacter sp.]
VYDDADEHYREAASNIGVFAQARLEPLAGLKLSFGTRFDWQEFEGEGGFSDSYDGMSNNLSASYALTDELVLRGGYSRVFGGLSIEDNYEYWRSPDWDYAGLKAGESENFTLGADFESGNLRLGGEVFLTKMQDARSYDGNFDFESRGFNLGATYGWDGGFARMTYSNSKVKVNGTLSSSYDAVDFGAPLGQVLALELQQGIGDSGWTLGGSLDLALDYDDVPDTAEEPQPAAARRGEQPVRRGICRSGHLWRRFRKHRAADGTGAQCHPVPGIEVLRYQSSDAWRGLRAPLLHGASVFAWRQCQG